MAHRFVFLRDGAVTHAVERTAVTPEQLRARYAEYAEGAER
jgi:hypothetical protein